MELLEEEFVLSWEQIQKKVQLQSAILRSLEEEELYWFKRSREKWLHEGDSNTEYFHRIANGRRRKKNIVSLKDGDSVIEGTDKLLLHATNFYKDLFGPAQGNLFPVDPSLWHEDELVSDEDNIWLTRPFSENEIKEALFQMEPNKAAGPDSVPVEFFQTCWDVIKYDLMELFDEFYSGKINISRLNYGIITSSKS